jgi:hypothetical protein
MLVRSRPCFVGSMCCFISYLLFGPCVDGSRRYLVAALGEHAAAVRGWEAVLGERAAGRPLRSPEADPWATEAALARQQQGLQRCQVRGEGGLWGQRAVWRGVGRQGGRGGRVSAGRAGARVV